MSKITESELPVKD